MGEGQEERQRQYTVKVQCVDNGNVDDTIGRLRAHLGGSIVTAGFAHPRGMDAKGVVVTLVLSFAHPVTTGFATDAITRQIESIPSPEPIVEGYKIEAAGGEPARGV